MIVFGRKPQADAPDGHCFQNNPFQNPNRPEPLELWFRVVALNAVCRPQRINSRLLDCKSNNAATLPMSKLIEIVRNASC